MEKQRPSKAKSTGSSPVGPAKKGYNLWKQKVIVNIV